MNRFLPLHRLFCLLPALALSDLPAQISPPAPPSSAPVAGGGIVELSPFTVNAAADRGYRAENTLAGSRLNSSLRDTPASVTVFTKEFLDDIGLNEIEKIIDYSVGSVVNMQDFLAGPNANALLGGGSLVKRIDVRGILAAQGIDYFKSITPNDRYRVGRYDESRGPNGILFGIGNAGGLINQSSIFATTHRRAGEISYQFGSNGISRAELQFNQVIVPKKAALAVAAVEQENEGWRRPGFQDKRRLFATFTITPHDRITFRAMAERGNEYRAIVAPFTATDAVLAWLDNRDARGVSAVTFTPTTAAPNAAQIALGVTGRNGAANATTRRCVYVGNTGLTFDAAGSYVTGSYNNPAVRAPDGTPGVSGDTMRINDPKFLPYDINSGGPGMFRDQNLANCTFTVDWRVTHDFNLNLAHNYQETDLINPHLQGANPAIAGEANRTFGINGPANPFAGQLYIDAQWQSAVHTAKYRETRLSFSYDLATPWKWSGTHRLAGMVARSEDRDYSVSQRLGFANVPFNPDPSNANNSLTTRIYLDGTNPATLLAYDWRKVPRTLNLGGRNYDVVWLDNPAGTGNSLAKQKVDARLLVMQSHFLNRRLVATVGYRLDEGDVTTFGHTRDPLSQIDIVDPDPAKATTNHIKGTTRTQGLVLHATNWFSLIANRSTNIGIPTFTNRVLPDGNPPDPSEGKGEDYGFALDLLSSRVAIKAVCFTTSQYGQTSSGGINARFNLPNVRIADALQGVLVGTGRPYTATTWAPIRQSITTTMNAETFDEESTGYEATLVASPTRQWRLTATYSYTDRVRSNTGGRDVIPWYGFTLEGKLVREGVTQNAAGRFVVDPAAFEPGRTVAKWIELGNLRPEASLSTLTTTGATTVAEEILTMIRALNNDKLTNEQRWGLRPHKISFFSAYDFAEGRLKGFSAGAGYRWRSANIIGRDDAGKEIGGRVLTAFDLMLRYRHSVSRGWFRGRLSYQLNVTNLLDQNGLLPQRFASTPGWIVPGGRGIGYSRFDLLDPREVRITTTFSF
jgi:hypothetical protein